MKIPTINNITPAIKGLNLFTLKQKLKDAIHTNSTIQLWQKIDIYSLDDQSKEQMLKLEGLEQQAFIKSHGKLVRTSGDMKAHSFVLGFLQLLENGLAHTYGGYSDMITIIDTSNVGRQTQSGVNASANYYACEAAATTSNVGIVVGTGTNAPASADYKLQTQTAHGNGANQLQYGSCMVSAAGIVGANIDLVIARIFANGSGGSITLKEIGLIIANWYNNTVGYFLAARDAVNQTINNGEIALISYDIRTTV
jgi:hypothetical protein